MSTKTGSEARTETGPKYGGAPAEAPPRRRRGAEARLRRYRVETRLRRFGRPSGALELNCGADVAAAMAHLRRLDREQVWCLGCDVRNRVVAADLVSIGLLDAALVRPREFYLGALLAGAASAIAVHNHPSGSAEPSPQDLDLTRALAEAGRLLGVRLLDHVIIGSPGHVSLAERGAL